MRRLLLAVALMTGTAVACGGALRGGASPPGQRTVKAKCSACHLTPRAGSLTSHEVDQVLREHGPRVRLSPADERDIRYYLARD